MPKQKLLGLIDQVSRILRDFAETNDAQLSDAIASAIESIARFMKAEQSYVYELSKDGLSIKNTHRWSATHSATCVLDSQIQTLFNIWKIRFSEGEHVSIASVQDLPDERVEEKDALLCEGIESAIFFLLLSSNRLHGFLGFDASTQAKPWNDVEIKLLRSVADIIVSGLVRSQNHNLLVQKKHRFRMLMQYSSDVITIINAQSLIVYASGSIHELLGGEPHFWLGQHYENVVHPEDVFDLQQALGKGSDKNVRSLPDFRIRARGGDYRWFSGNATDLRHDPSVLGWVINAHDITLRKNAEQALLHQAHHDPLTGLSNRALLLERMHAMHDTQQMIGLLFIDLDHFKVVNDDLGHDIGDQLLVDVASRLQTLAQPGDTVARFGGDEFVVLLGPHASSYDAIVAASTRFLHAFDVPFQVKKRERVITASAGVVVASGEWDPGVLLRDADAAMYQAKAKGRNRLQVFDAKMQKVLHEKVELANDLRNSERRGELYLLYQPVYDIDGVTLRSVEALLRWKHPQKGIISPVDFIPVAEDTGMILPIGIWVLNEALSQMRQWLDQHPQLGQFNVSINLSTRQLTMPGLVDIINAALMRHRINASRLTIELTESALMKEVDISKRVLHDIQALGCRLAIDDFGTGYSSMAYLRDLPVTALKIDKSFVAQMQKTQRDLRIVAAMINIATELGMETVAEGVETAEQMLALRGLRCGQLQGFYLMRPSPPDLIAGMLKKLECPQQLLKVTTP